ncbi:hypothetical protein GGR57DRAFT_484124 [Xylariaceae sp. FL1272]|nr:hypothetical protein GGR57DRAFT_484124 [Xylariaceae sp. FL1272]
MGKASGRDGVPADAVSLHSNVGESSSSFPFTDDDAPELDIDDLPPNYTDAVDGSEGAPMLPPDSNTPAVVPAILASVRPRELDATVVKDLNTGAEAWIAKSVENPEDLANYVRQLAVTPPRPYIKLVGTHTETTRDRDDKPKKTTVVDFDVSVELTPYLYRDAQYRESWTRLRTVENSDKVRRGTVLRKRAPGSNQSIEVGGDPHPTLQEWCHRFSASHAGLKCFVFQRQMTGLDEELLVLRLKQLVRDTNYRGHLNVSIVSKDAHFELYNDAKINRWRFTSWITWLFYLSFLWIFSWPYLFFRTKRWEVAVAEWSFSRITESGTREYVSISEEQWYNMWAFAICRAVMEKRQTLLDQADLRNAHEAQPNFASGNSTVDGALGLFRAGINAMNEVNRQLGWGGDR